MQSTQMEQKQDITQGLNLKKLKLNDQRVESLIHIYSNIFNQETDKRIKRYEAILGRFQKIYGEEPQYFVRAPAIVNLFGDSAVSGIDYRKLSFPIEQDIVIAVKKNSKNKEIRINHMQQILYPQQKIETDYNQLQFKGLQTQLQTQEQQKKQSLQTQAEANTDHFHNLFVAGYKAALTGVDASSLSGMDILIDFNFQQNSSLGFSNAYQIASAFASLAINTHVKPNFDILLYTLQKYKNVCCQKSKDVNGYSQILGLISQKTHLYSLSQNHSSIESTKFPPIDKKPGNNMVFLLADSLTERVKLMSEGHRTDKRICEVRIGIQFLLKQTEITKDTTSYKTLKQLSDFLNYPPEDMQECVKQHIEDREYTAQELEYILETPLHEICSDIPYIETVIKTNASFNPRKILLHYLQEEELVDKMNVLLNSSSQNTAEQNLKTWDHIANLMNKSYESQKEQLQCTSENIEKLRNLMLQLGCKGVKLLGQGWDGVLIGLIPESKVDKTIEFITDEYYLKKDNKLSVTDDIDQYLYKSFPCVGAKQLDPEFEIWFV